MRTRSYIGNIAYIHVTETCSHAKSRLKEFWKNFMLHIGHITPIFKFPKRYLKWKHKFTMKNFLSLVATKRQLGIKSTTLRS